MRNRRHRFRTIRTAKQTTTARGYGRAHREARQRALNAATPDTPCCLCARPLGTLGPNIHLDHCPTCKGHGCSRCGGTGYRGLAHSTCNRDDGARRGRARQAAAQTQTHLRW